MNIVYSKTGFKRVRKKKSDVKIYIELFLRIIKIFFLDFKTAIEINLPVVTTNPLNK